MAPMAENLILLLKSCNQKVEDNLISLADEYSKGGFKPDPNDDVHDDNDDNEN